MERCICFFDLETRQGPLDLDPTNENHGWAKMRRGEGGISALAIHNDREDWTFVYDDHDILDIAAHLEAADVVIGYSSHFFDVPVVEGLLGRKLALKYHLDLYEEIKKSLFKNGILQRKGENKLDSVCKRTLGVSKIEHGSNAPTLAKDGRWGRLFNYCMDDVRLTKKLFEHIQTTGGVISPNGTFMKVEIPEWLRKDTPSE